MERITTRNISGVAVYKHAFECERCGETIYRLYDNGNGSPTDKLAEYEDAEEHGIYGKWIPVSERLPETDKYIMLSFDNFALPDIGRYEVNDNGDGGFYPGDDEKSYVSYGLFVNAWMPLPDAYKESEGCNNEN